MILKTTSLFKNKYLKFILLSIFIGNGIQTNAQIIHKEERFISNYKWKVGLSMNMMDMNFNHNELPEGAKMITMTMPSKATLAYEFVNNLSIEAAFSMNKIEAGNYSNGTLITANKDIYTFDGSLLYSLGGLFNLPVVDPYIKGGIGYLGFGDRNYTTADFGGGINFWLADFGFLKDYRYPKEKWYQRLGINIEAIGKKNISNSTALGSHAQFSAGLFYTF